jgi:Ca2+-binding RTX toxin-like protein
MADVTGTNGDNFLPGTTGDDVINALDGNDTVAGTQGHDVVDGGAGYDQFNIRMGFTDRFAAATGARTYTVTSGNIVDSSGTLNSDFSNVERVWLDTVGTGNFNDTIDASGFVSANTGFGALRLTLGDGSNTVTGSGMSEWIWTGLGSNTVNTGGGYDEVYVYFNNSTSSTLTVTGSGGTVLTSIDGVTNSVTNAELVGLVGTTTNAATTTIDASALTGFTGQLIFWDNNGSNVDIGSTGSDTFSNVTGATLGHDVYSGNGGADTFDYTYAIDAMNGDTITDFDSNDTIDLRFNNLESGGSPQLCNHFIGSAAFSGVAGQYRYFAIGGQTFVQVDSNGDSVADQTLTISNGQFALAETAAGSNILHIVGTSGSSGPDSLTGTLGNDALYGQQGGDIVFGSQGTDFVDGGPGNDRLSFNVGNTSLFDAPSGAQTYIIGPNSVTNSSGTVATTFTSVERIALNLAGTGDHNDIVDASGFVSSNVLPVDISLGNGNNQVTGSSGSDRIWTGFGTNVVDAGNGHDYGFVQVNASGDVTVSLTTSGQTLSATVNGLTSSFTNFEEVQVFGLGAGTVTINAAAWAPISGQQLYLVGHTGTDIMVGSAGSDFFGNVTGTEHGHDMYTGNGGADIYDYTYAADSMNGDTITDFDIDDIIDFRFNNLEAGGSPLLCTKFIGAADFSGAAGEYRYQIDGVTTIIQLDSNGDRVTDATLTIANGGFVLAETQPGSNMLTLASVIQTVDGVVADGYLAGATLFVDVNGNGVRDNGEAWTTTDSHGDFTLHVNQTGNLVAVGGTNIDTGLANGMTMTGLAGNDVVNPLTTLVAAVFTSAGGALTEAAAEAKVKAALGISATVDLAHTDLIAAAATDVSALAAQKAAAIVANLVSTVEGASGSTSTSEATLLGNVASTILNSAAHVDLTDQGTLTNLLSNVLPASEVNAVVTEVSSEGAVIAAATSLTQISAAQVDAFTFNYIGGTSGDDWLDGGTGRDRIAGGNGHDYLTGGGGDDIFVAELTSTRLATKAGTMSVDTIIDFSAGDRIELGGIDANALLAGHQSFTFIGTAANKAAGDLSYKIFDSVQGAEKALGFDIDGVAGKSPYAGPVTVLFGNVDGGSPDFAIALIGAHDIATSDLLFG